MQRQAPHPKSEASIIIVTWESELHFLGGSKVGLGKVDLES